MDFSQAMSGWKDTSGLWRGLTGKSPGPRAPQSMTDKYNQAFTPAGTEPALIHEKTGSAVRIREDGSIELSVAQDVGIILDPLSHSIIMQAQNISQVGSLDWYTPPINGVKWNKFPLNLKPVYTGMAGTIPVVGEGMLVPIPAVQDLAGAIAKVLAIFTPGA